MVDLLVLIVITSIALYGSKVTWQEGMIFEKPKKLFDWLLFKFIEDVGPPNFAERIQARIGRYLSKPLYACPACMVSVWGSMVYYFCVSSTNHIVNYPVFLLATCGLTWILMWQFPFDD